MASSSALKTQPLDRLTLQFENDVGTGKVRGPAFDCVRCRPGLTRQPLSWQFIDLQKTPRELQLQQFCTLVLAEMQVAESSSPAPSERQEVASHSSGVKVRTNETVLFSPDGTACISYRTLKSRNHGSSCMLRGTICRQLALSLPLPATGDFLLHLAGAGLGQGQNRDAVTQRARPRHPSAGDVCRGRHHAPDR